MVLQAFKDYVFCDSVKMILDHGVFVGTQRYLFFIPDVLKEFKGHTQITTRISYADRAVKDVIADLIAACASVEELEAVLLEMSVSDDKIVMYKLDELESFKVEASFLGAGIHIKKAGKRGFSPFIQRLGKDKKEIKAFYANHPKHH